MTSIPNGPSSFQGWQWTEMSIVSYAYVSYEEEDTCVSYEEEDT